MVRGRRGTSKDRGVNGKVGRGGSAMGFEGARGGRDRTVGLAAAGAGVERGAEAAGEEAGLEGVGGTEITAEANVPEVDEEEGRGVGRGETAGL